MKTICLFNQKGGVAKTTTNINLGTYLAIEGFKVLLIDVDPQGNTTSGLGIDKSSVKKSIYNLFVDEDCSLDEIIIESQIIKNLFIAPSSIELAGAETEISLSENREFILKNKIEKLSKDFDFIFIDCPPSLNFLSLNALVSSNSILIPIQCEFYALEGLGQLINTINLISKSLNKSLYIEGVLLTMFDSRANLSTEIVKEVKEYFKQKVYNTMIPRNIKLAEAPSFGLPIILYDNKCKGSEAYKNLTKEFLNRQNQQIF